MKKNIYKILFTIVCMFMTVGIVIAATGTGTGETNGDGGSSSTEDLRIPNSNGPSGNYMYGIRVSFYTSTGTKIASKDYLAKEKVKYPSEIYTQYREGSSPCTKLDKCGNGEWQKNNSVASTADLTNIFVSSGIGISIDSVIQSRTLSKSALFSQILVKGGDDLGKQLFLNFGIDYTKYYKPNVVSYDLFLVWEPLGSITYYGKSYVGTAHELLTFVDGVPGTYGSGNYTAYQYVSNALTTGMGCAVNLDNSDSFGNSVGKKFPTSFNSRSYFNGKLDASEAGTVLSLCNANARGSQYRSYALNNEKGFTSPFAVGILWFDEIGEGINDGVECKDVQDHYGNGNISNGQTIISNSIKNNGTFNFNSFNNKTRLEGKKFPVGAESGITTQWYSTYCDNGEPGGIDCTPTYNVPSCTSGDNKTLVYKDSTDWEHCIFTDVNDGKQNTYTVNPHKWSDKDQPLTYYDKNLSSPYCDVYCIEEVYGNFDSNNPTVLAGNHFVWGWSKVQTIRTCKTKSINIGSKTTEGSFLYDLNKANEAIVSALAQNKLASVNSGGTWSVEATHPGEWKTCTQSGPSAPGSPPTYNDCPANATHVECHETTPGYHSCTYKYWKDATCTDYKYSKSYTSESVTVGSITKSATVASTVFSKCQFETPSGNPVSAGNVDSAIKNLETVIANYKKCYEFANENVLNDNSNAHISYKSSNGEYDYSGEMKATRSSSYDDASCTTTTPFEAFTVCSGTTCSTTSINLYNCLSHTEVGTSTTDFSLAGDVYQYVIKNPNDLTLKSVHTSSFRTNYENATTSNYESDSVWKYNWTNIGYSNFPVPFNANAESYEGSLIIDYTNIGHTTNSSTNVDTILKSVPSYERYGQYGNWSCGYEVEYDFIEDNDDNGGPGDINVIYREIDLYNPFPDTNSKGRHTGANWCSLENCDYDKDNAVVNSYILQNRNVTGDDIYYLEPMYTFIMTPSDIIKIRRYNDKNTYSSYEGTLDHKKYAFTCTRGSLRNCRSDYLSQLLIDLESEKYPGSCKGDRDVYKGNTASSQFESCRYKGK